MKENKIIRFIGKLLFINNLIGILCYPDLTLLSLVFIMGIPGVIAFIIYAYWLYKNEKRNRFLILFLAAIMIWYNYIIYQITLDDIGSEFSSNGIRLLLKAEYFPIINVALNSILALTSIIVLAVETMHGDPDTNDTGD